MLVLVHVSSINTSRAASNMPCCRIQRRRARAISARFCSAAYKVFFEADVPSLKEPPHRAAAAWDAFFPHGRDDFIQRQVGLLDDQSQQKFRMLLKRRSTAATWLRCNAASFFPVLGPKHHYTRAEFVAVRRLPTRRTGLDRFDYSGTQVGASAMTMASALMLEIGICFRKLDERTSAPQRNHR